MIRVTVTKVDERLFDAEALSVSVPGSEGMMTILPHHEPIISALKGGRVTIKTKKEEHVFDIEKGALEVSNNRATVLL